MFIIWLVIIIAALKLSYECGASSVRSKFKKHIEDIMETLERLKKHTNEMYEGHKKIIDTLEAEKADLRAQLSSIRAKYASEEGKKRTPRART